MSYFTPEQEDTLREIMNIGMGKAMSSLVDMINSDARIDLGVPEVHAVSLQDIITQKHYADKKVSAVILGFQGPLHGLATLVFTNTSGVNLVNLLTEDESDEIDDMVSETLNEVGNIVINSIMGSIANILKVEFEYSIPVFKSDFVENIFKEHQKDSFILVTTEFRIDGKKIDGNVIVVLSKESLIELQNNLDLLYAN